MRLARTAMTHRTGALIVAAALLCSGQAFAQSSSSNGVSNFLGNIFSGPKSSPQAQASPPGPDSTPPAPSAPLPWTGEDGASGHPMMTAAAIRQAAANFPNCVAAMWPDAARRQVTQANFERFTTGLAPDLRIMDLMDSQPEFTKSIWDYLDILVNDNCSPRAARCWLPTRRNSMRWKKPMASTATRSHRSGASNRIIRR